MKPCDCGAMCDYEDSHEDGEPCWGTVSAVDEVLIDDEWGHYWIHACEGHEDQAIGMGPYRPKKISLSDNASSL